MHLPAIISAVLSLGYKLDLSDYSHAHLLLSWNVIDDGILNKFPTEQPSTTQVKSCAGNASQTRKGEGASKIN